MNAIDEAEEVVLLTGTAAAVIFTNNFKNELLNDSKTPLKKKRFIKPIIKQEVLSLYKVTHLEPKKLLTI
jgi:hypothetical protein